MEVKDRIRQKADELFRRYGIRSVTMDEIATQLGVSKKTIYQFYADKDELVDAVMDDEIACSQQDCLTCMSNARNAIDEIFLTMEFIEKQFRNMNPSIVHDLQRFHIRGFEKLQQHKYNFIYKLIRANLERGIAEELYRPEINTDIITKFRLESMMLAFNIELFPPAQYNLAQLEQEIIEHYLYGLATIKGYKLILKYKQERTNKPTKE
jgi:TetR/AcrR family transcriptional regulator, cholesterol catabolism regulator